MTLLTPWCTYCERLPKTEEDEDRKTTRDYILHQGEARWSPLSRLPNPTHTILLLPMQSDF